MLDQPRLLTLPMTAAYFRLILRRFGATTAARTALLRGTDGEGADTEIAVRDQLRQLDNLNGLAPAAWGLELGATLDGVTHGPAGVVIVTAGSLAAALEAAVRYMTVRTPFVDLEVTREPARFVLRVVEPCDLGAFRTSLLEMVLLSLQGVVASALGQRLHAATFTMPAPRPAYWRRYAEFFHAPVTFMGDAAALSLPADWLALPCPLADPVVHRSACTRLESLRQRLAGDFVDARVERILEGSHDAGPSLPEVAAQLRMSPRTLVRRLGARATSYRALVDGHRRGRAADLLAQPGLTLAEIAGRLGYDEPTNFGRACRRWFGVSPTVYRRTASAS